MTVAVTQPNRTVFWFVVFGWSGIAATFCPTMIMSLYWKGLTVGGVIASMVTGFVCVPLFKFVIFPIEGIGTWLSPLSELPPAFLLSIIAGVAVSHLDARRAPDRFETLSDNAQTDLKWAARNDTTSIT